VRLKLSPSGAAALFSYKILLDRMITCVIQ
jgi:hypothetical protein